MPPLASAARDALPAAVECTVDFEAGGSLLRLNRKLTDMQHRVDAAKGCLEVELSSQEELAQLSGTVVGAHGLVKLDAHDAAANAANRESAAAMALFEYEPDAAGLLSGASESVKLRYELGADALQQLQRLVVVGNVRSLIPDEGSLTDNSDVVKISNEYAATPAPQSMQSNAAPSLLVAALLARYIELQTEPEKRINGAVFDLADAALVPSIRVLMQSQPAEVRFWGGTLQLAADGDGYTLRCPLTLSGPLQGQDLAEPPVMRVTLSKSTIDGCCVGALVGTGVCNSAPSAARASAAQVHEALSHVVANRLGPTVTDAALAVTHTNNSIALALGLKWSMHERQMRQEMGAQYGAFETAIKQLASDLGRGATVTFPQKTENVVIPSASAGTALPIGVVVAGDVRLLPAEAPSAHEQVLEQAVRDAAQCDPYLDVLGVSPEDVRQRLIDGVNEYRAEIQAHWQAQTQGGSELQALRGAASAGSTQFPEGFQRVVAPVLLAMMNANNTAYRYSHDYQMFVDKSGAIRKQETELMNNPIGVQTWESMGNVAPSGDCEDRAINTQLLLSYLASRVNDRGEVEAWELPPLGGRDVRSLTEALAWTAQYAVACCVTLCSVYGAQLSDQDSQKNLGLHAVPTFWVNAQEFRESVRGSAASSMTQKLADGVGADPALTPGGWPAEALALDHAKFDLFARNLPRVGGKPAEGTGPFVMMPFEQPDDSALARRVPPPGPLREAMGQTQRPAQLVSCMAFAGRYTMMAACGEQTGLGALRENTDAAPPYSRFYHAIIAAYAPLVYGAAGDAQRPATLATVEEQRARGVAEPVALAAQDGCRVAQFPSSYTAAALTTDAAGYPLVEMHPRFGVWAHAQSGQRSTRSMILIPDGRVSYQELTRLAAVRDMAAIPARPVDRVPAGDLPPGLQEVADDFAAPEGVDAQRYVVRDYTFNQLAGSLERPWELMAFEMAALNEAALDAAANMPADLRQAIEAEQAVGAYVVGAWQCEGSLPWQRSGYTHVRVALLEALVSDETTLDAVLQKLQAEAKATTGALQEDKTITVGVYETAQAPDAMDAMMDLRPTADVAKLGIADSRSWASHRGRLNRRAPAALLAPCDGPLQQLHAAALATGVCELTLPRREPAPAPVSAPAPEPEEVAAAPVAQGWNSRQKSGLDAAEPTEDFVTVGDTFAVNGEVHFATRELQCVMRLFSAKPTQDRKLSYLLQHLNTSGFACDRKMLNQLIQSTKVKNPSRENRSYAHPVFELLGDQSKDPMVSLHAIALHLLMQLKRGTVDIKPVFACSL
jgi:hypothetical protein